MPEAGFTALLLKSKPSVDLTETSRTKTERGDTIVYYESKDGTLYRKMIREDKTVVWHVFAKR